MLAAKKQLSFVTLLMLISFASINAVLFTPALPTLANYFGLSNNQIELTLTYYLFGYTLGQLIYGPLANRFGRKPTLYIGIGVAIASSGLCIASGYFDAFSLLLVGRFCLALGAGVGLKMTFTLVNECYEPQQASKIISYLIMAFAIAPGLGVATGGVLTHYFGWQSCFYVSVIYSFALLMQVRRLPETLPIKDKSALQLSHLWKAYASVCKPQLFMGGLLMGSCTSFVYVFAAVSPFIAINLMGLSSAQYGFVNLLPACGMLLGSLYSAHLTNHYAMLPIIRRGICIAAVGVALMLRLIQQ